MVAHSSAHSQTPRTVKPCTSCAAPTPDVLCRECFDREWAAWVRQQFGPDAPTEIQALLAWRDGLLPPQRNRSFPASGEEPPLYADEVDYDSPVEF